MTKEGKRLLVMDVSPWPIKVFYPSIKELWVYKGVWLPERDEKTSLLIHQEPFYGMCFVGDLIFEE